MAKILLQDSEEFITELLHLSKERKEYFPKKFFNISVWKISDYSIFEFTSCRMATTYSVTRNKANRFVVMAAARFCTLE